MITLAFCELFRTGDVPSIFWGELGFHITKRYVSVECEKQIKMSGVRLPRIENMKKVGRCVFGGFVLMAMFVKSDDLPNDTTDKEWLLESKIEDLVSRKPLIKTFEVCIYSITYLLRLSALLFFIYL